MTYQMIVYQRGPAGIRCLMYQQTTHLSQLSQEYIDTLNHCKNKAKPVVSLYENGEYHLIRKDYFPYR